MGVDGKAAACVAYLPLPGLGLVATLMAPQDPFARYHARQGGLLVGLLYVILLLFGLCGQAAPQAKDLLAALAAPVLLLGLAGILWGMAGALRGRFVRIRPIWDLCASIWLT